MGLMNHKRLHSERQHDLGRRTSASVIIIIQRMHCREQAKEVSSLVTATDAYVFICGDGAHMAHDVHAALLDALTLHIGMTPSEAIDHMASMAKQGRYVRDIWS